MVDEPRPPRKDCAMAETEHLNRMLLDAFRAVDRQVDAALEARGAKNLSPRHATALVLIDKKGIRLTDLAARAGITKQAMMQVVNDLAKWGLVTRAKDPSDARAKTVSLTAKGQKERTEASKAVSAAEQKVRRRLGLEQYDSLKATLATLIG
jgi:DNA-binding MarR family transcriptional regulator